MYPYSKKNDGEAHPRSCAMFILALIFVSLFAAPFIAREARAAQIYATLVPEFNNGSGTFSVYKFLEIQYPPGSKLSKEFDGQNERVDLQANYTADRASMDSVMAVINKNMLAGTSSVKATSLDVRYTATVRGAVDRADIAIKIDLIPTFSGILLTGLNTSNATASDRPMIVDMDWRGLVIAEPVYLVQQNQSRIDINNAAQALMFHHQNTAKILMLSESANSLLKAPIIDFSSIGKMDLNRWDTLFDPTQRLPGANASITSDPEIGTARVLSVYSLGQCSLKQGCPQEQEQFADGNVNGVPVKLQMDTPPPNAQIQVAGYATVEGLAGTQVLSVTLSDKIPKPNEFFPIQVLVVLGGMMGGIAVFVLAKARK